LAFGNLSSHPCTPPHLFMAEYFFLKKNYFLRPLLIIFNMYLVSF
jgi:hypothetical protein